MGDQSVPTTMAPSLAGVSGFASILSQFSEKVRASTLKRLRLVQPNDRCWRVRDDLLSFIDVLAHLVDADQWLFDLLDGKKTIETTAVARQGNPGEWDSLMEALAAQGAERSRRFAALTDRDLFSRQIATDRHGLISLPQLILRYSLDHEIQQRGALQLALRLKYS